MVKPDISRVNAQTTTVLKDGVTRLAAAVVTREAAVKNATSAAKLVTSHATAHSLVALAAGSAVEGLVVGVNRTAIHVAGSGTWLVTVPKARSATTVCHPLF